VASDDADRDQHSEGETHARAVQQLGTSDSKVSVNHDDTVHDNSMADEAEACYLKPLSLQPWRIGNRIVDEDAAFVKQVLNLSFDPWDLSPVVITPEFLRSRLTNPNPEDLMGIVKKAYQVVSQEKLVKLNQIQY
jgi:hypothetical protein